MEPSPRSDWFICVPEKRWARKILDFLRKKEPEFLDTDTPVAGRDLTVHEGTVLSSTKQKSEEKHLNYEINNLQIPQDSCARNRNGSLERVEKN